MYGPRQIAGRIDQDQIISPQITLWNQQGSEVKFGTLLVIPIEESLLYVRPLYLRSPEGRIPELKRVIVAYQNQIIMAETLKLALVQIFGPGIAAALPADRLQGTLTSKVPSAEETAPVDLSTGVPSDLAGEAQAHWDRAQKALKDGNFALFGEEYQKLGETLARMNKGANKK